MDLGSIVAHLKLETQQFMSGVRDAVQGVNQIENSLDDLNRVGDTVRNMGSEISNSFSNMGSGSTRLNKQLEQLAYQLGGEVPESTRQAYSKLYELNNEVKKAERGYGTYSQQAIQARKAVTDWALSLDDTTFKQVYMRSQLGLTDAQLQQQASSIKLNHRMTKLMGNQTQILTQRMQGLQRAGIKPEMLLPASTPGAFKILNETIAQGHSPLNRLSGGFRTLGNSVEGVIKKYSAQKVAVREANGDMVKYGLVLRGLQTGIANLSLAMPIMGLAAVAAYKNMFNAALEADEGLAKLAETTKGKLSKAFEPVIDAAGKFLEVVFKVVGAVADWIAKFNEAHPVIAKVAGALAFLLPALTLLMAPLALGVGLFKGWMLMLNSVWPLISGVATAMGVAGSTALALTGIIGALAVAFIALWKNSETFRDICTNAWETVKSKVSGAVDAISGYLNKLKSEFEKGGIKGVFQTLQKDISELVSKIKEKAPQMLEAGIKMIENFCNGITQNFPKIAARGREIISNLLDGLSKNMPNIINKAVEIINMFAQNWLANASTFIPLGLQVISSLIQGIAQAMPEIVTMIITVITTLIDTFVTLLPQLIQVGVEILLTLIDGIIQALPQLIDAAIQAIETIADALIDNLPLILDAAIQIIMALLDGLIEALPQLMEAGFEIIVTLVEAIINNLPEIISASWEIIKAVVQGIDEVKDSLFEKGKELMTKLIQIIIEKCIELATKAAEKFNELKEKCAEKLEELKTKAKDKLNQLKTDAINKFNELKTQAANKIEELKTQAINKFNEIKTQVTNKINELKTQAVNKVNELKTQAVNKFNEIKNSVTTSISSLVSSAKTKFNEMKTAITSKLSEAKTQAVSKMQELASGMKSALTGLPGQLKTAASNAVQGLIDGLASKLQAVKQKAKEIADAVSGALKNALKIKSPSRLIRDEVGKMIPQGLAVGIQADADKAINSAKSLAESVALGTMQPLKNTMSSTGIRSYSSSSSNVSLSAGERAIISELSKMTGLLEERETGLNVNIEEFNNNTDQDVNTLMQRMAAQIKLSNLSKGVR